MGRSIQILHHPFLFKIKNYLLYYSRFATTGVFLGFVTLSVWKSFLPGSVITNFIKLDSVLILQYKTLLNFWATWPTLLFIVLIFTTTIIFIWRGYQLLLRTALITIGLGFWILLNSYNFWTIPYYLESWLKPVSFISILFNLALIFVTLDFTLLIVNKIIALLKTFVFNLKINTKIGDKKINLDIPHIIENARSKKENNNDNQVNFSDEPLKDLDEMYSIRKVVNNNDIFSNFLTRFENVNTLLNRKDNYKNYTRSICLDGPWGSGKTSLVNILREKNKTVEDCKITWIDFSPWNFNNSTEFIKDFFDTLNKELVSKYRIELQPNLKLYVDLITPIIETTGFFGSIRSILLEMPFFAPKNLSDLKESLDQKLASIPEKIVIVLDDIDRLKLEELEIVLQLVRQLSNFRNVLFILPFDYNRISNLITKQKGETYADFLGKIVNSRIRLSGYDYPELEAIFMASISHKLSAKLRNELEKTFDVYTKERIRSRFEEIREREASNTSSDPTLKPMVGFARELFKILYPNSRYMNKYVESVAAMNKIKDLYLGEYYEDTQSLIEGIIENFSSIKKQEFLQEFTPKRQEIDTDVNSLNPSQDQRTEIDRLWGVFTDSLKNGQPYQTIEKEWANFRTYDPINTLVQNKTAASPVIEQIDDSLKKYKREFEDSAENRIGIKNWLIQNTTPRQVKDLARSITDEIDIGDITNLAGAVETIAIRVASMQ